MVLKKNTKSIFSPYRTKENIATSTILAVFEKINSSTVNSILQVLLGEDTSELIKYENQVKGVGSIPDGRIKGLFDYWIETKIVSFNTHDILQLQTHLDFVYRVSDYSKLILITKDHTKPPKLNQIIALKPDRLIWTNFDKLVAGIDYALEESALLMDREKFLLHELKEFIINLELLTEDFSKKVLIIPANNAWDFYNKYEIYKCQPNRTFQPSSYLGFYKDEVVMETLPKIMGHINIVNIQKYDPKKVDVIVNKGYTRKNIINKLYSFKKRVGKNYNGQFKYVFLDKDEAKVIILPTDIRNDKKDKNGNKTAFTQNQSYSNIDLMQKATKTSDLI